MTEVATADFLLEIGTEELPPKAIDVLAKSLANHLGQAISDAGLSFDRVYYFSTPRRLAVRIESLLTHQQDSIIEKKGPSLKAAFDEKGKPTKALLGFAQSCNAEISDLSQIETPKGTWMIYKSTQHGNTTASLLPTMVIAALKQLPIPKMMRWSDHEFQFVRPVHWVVMLLDKEVIPATIFGKTSGNFTHGHRFLSPEMIQLHHPKEYEETLLSTGHVLADAAVRKANIIKQVDTIAKELNALAILDDALVNEVTNLVEWPLALLCSFDKALLGVPQEALICAMQGHQKCFPITTKAGKLLPYFVTISNIQTDNPKKVVKDNEKVMEARLKDAAFFYENDQNTSLIVHVETLKRITYQKKLGSLYDKTERVRVLASWIATKLNVDQKLTERAALLCKADLVTDMVGEFPGLQGIMGSYYATLSKEPDAVAIALKEVYMPLSAKADLPSTDIGAIVSLADKCDTLVSIMGVGLKPTGDKDPFALRRAALGLLRILVDKQWPLSINELFEQTSHPFESVFDAPSVCDQVINYCLQRLKGLYKQQGISADVFQSVEVVTETLYPFDFDQRIQAVTLFKGLPEAKSLAATNKRVQNILSKNTTASERLSINPKLLQAPAEITLAGAIDNQTKSLTLLAKQGEYYQVLTQLATMQAQIDLFFDQVMVMSDDKKIQNNRLAILMALRDLFLLVADISKLQI